MKKRYHSWLLFFLLALSPLVAHAETDGASAEQPSAARANPKQEAARRFEHAIKLYEDGDYALALAEFERVYELVPDYRVLYNIGQVSIQLGRYARALRTLREYVKRGGSELPPDRRSAVQADLVSLEARTASVELVIEPAGAEVSIDGVVVGKAPLVEPLVVDVGERAISVRLSGHVTHSETLTLAGGDQRQLSVTLEAEAAVKAPPVLAPAPVPAAQPKAPGVHVADKPGWLWAGWSATGALTVSSVVCAALGASAASALQAERDSPDATRSSLDAARSRARTRLLLADVLGVAAVAAGGTTLYFQLTSSRSRAERPPASRVSLGMQPGGVSVRLEHRAF